MIGRYGLGIRGLDIGTYYLKETKAPDGYKQVTESFDFTADNDGHIHFTDTPTFITEMIGAASHTVGGPNKGDILELTWEQRTFHFLSIRVEYTINRKRRIFADVA